MSQADIKSRAEEILFPKEHTYIPLLGSKDVTLTVEQLRQLIAEKVVEGDSAYNYQLTLQEFLDIGDALVNFLNNDADLQLEFFGFVSFQLNQIQLGIHSFELCHKEKLNIESAIDIMPIVSKFVCQHRADEFTLKESLFSAWWD